jgi:PAS domain S-box-containing protein
MATPSGFEPSKFRPSVGGAEAHLVALIESTSDLIWAVDPDFRLSTLNTATFEHLRKNYGVHARAGMTVEELLPPEKAKVWRSFYERALAGGPYTMEYAPGGGRILDLTLHLIVEGGKTTGVSVFGRDVTARRAAEQALGTAEAKYRAIFQGALEGIFRSTEGGRLIEVNPAFADILGYDSPSEALQLLSDSWQQLWAATQERARLSDQLRQQGAVRGYECQLRRKDGVLVWVAISARLIRGEEGEALYYQGFLEEITERKLMEIALRKSEEKFAKAFLCSPAATVLSDLEAGGRLIAVNEAFERITGYRSAEVVGRTTDEIGLWTIPGQFDTPRSILLARGRLRNLEIQVQRKGGEVGTGLLSAEPIELDGTTHAIVAGIDITELKEAEQKHSRLEDQLRQAQKLESIGRLAGGVAHDFNNLLTVINGYSEQLLGQLDPGSAQWREAKEIATAGDRATALTAQLLAFSRKQIPERKPVSLNAIVVESERMLRRLIGEDIHLDTNLAPEIWFVMADPGQIHQVLMNVVVNARDAMPNGGRLEIEIENVGSSPDAAGVPGEQADPYVAVTVRDSGVGMDEATLQRAFEPFFTTKEQGKGTGLGLSTVYGIIKQNGGWAELASQPGIGTTFRFCLPRTDTPSRAEAPAKATAIETVRELTVLLVEDQPGVRKFAKRLLESQGCAVLEAENGAEALLAAESHQGEIHLLLTDVILPGLNGKEVLERLRIVRPGLKAVFMSGYTDDIIAPHGVLEPGVVYLAKPFTPAALAAKLTEALAGKQERPE